MNVLRDASNRIFLSRQNCERVRTRIYDVYTVSFETTPSELIVIFPRKDQPEEREPAGCATRHVFPGVCTYPQSGWLQISPGRILSLVEGAAGETGLIIYSDKDARLRYWPIKNPRYGRARVYTPSSSLPPDPIVFYIVAFGSSPSPDHRDVDSWRLGIVAWCSLNGSWKF